MKRITALLAAILAVGALGACGERSGNGLPGSSDASGTSSPTTAATTTATQPVVATGTLDLGVVGLVSLDPLTNSSPSTVAVNRFLFQPLVGLDAKTSEPTPLLARKWSVNATQTEFTLTLDAKAKFHDGSPVTAADAAATLTRVKFASAPVAALLSDLPGTGIVAKDAHTLVLTTSSPDADLVAKLSNPAFGILPAAAVADPGAAFLTGGVGSGPFRVKSMSASLIELVPAAKHGPGAAPSLQRVVVHRYASATEAAAAFTKGDVDLTWVGNEQWTTVSESSTRAGVRPYLAVGYYGFNIADPVLADARLRQAIVLAVNAEKVARAGFGRDAVAAEDVISTAVPGGRRMADTAGVAGDPVAAAKALVAQVYPNGGVPTINIDFEDTVTQRAVVTELVAEMAAVGIPAAPRPHPAAEYSAFLAAGGAQMFRSGWASDAPTSFSFVNPSFWPGSPENVTNVGGAELTTALAEASYATSSTARAAKAREAADVVLAQYAALPIVQYQTRLAATKNVRGLAVDAFGTFDPTGVTVVKSVQEGKS